MGPPRGGPILYFAGDMTEPEADSGQIIRRRLRAAGPLFLVGAAAIAVVLLTHRIAPAFVGLARALAAVVIIAVAVSLFRDFRTRQAQDRREDERREGERRDG